MELHWLRKWLHSWKNTGSTAQEQLVQPEIRKKKNVFSPMTYRNPYITFMHLIIEQVLRQKKLSYQKMELVIIDAEDGRDEDDEDIQMVLYELRQLNYLLLVTDRPDRYEQFTDEMYEENGLIVQQLSKSASGQPRGNLVLDFERSSGILGVQASDAKAVYLPVYKRPWEIGENLDILVPVGYNTLVVDGILPPEWQTDDAVNERIIKDRMIDRLDREFRKG
ncbi:MAG: hypothetical protein K2P45_01625 [Eubacterium sp.]|nr:hypothetical protein [Eubacterium sp.]